jgi:hypothetical protein
MFYEFAHRHTVCTVDGVSDKLILSRDTSSSSVSNKEYKFIGRFSPLSLVEEGSLVISEDSFFVQSKRKTPDNDLYCGMVKTNALVTIQRKHQDYDGNDNPTGPATYPDVVANVVGFVEFANASLRMKQEGLLPTTTYTLIIQSGVDVERLDRIMVNSRPYQVDVVDDIKYPNLLFIELSEDLR